MVRALQKAVLLEMMPAMEQRPLDYASPFGVRIKNTPTPEQLRFRRRVRWALVLIFVAGLLPYPTQTLPAIDFIFVDENGKPETDLVSIHWEGGAGDWNEEGYVSVDTMGKASLPSQRIWASPFSRLFAQIKSIMPHEGYTRPWGRTFFRIPISVDKIDTKAMQLQEDVAARTPRSELWTIPATNDQLSISYEPGNRGADLFVSNPGRWSATTLRIIMRRVTPPATSPIR